MTETGEKKVSWEEKHIWATKQTGGKRNQLIRRIEVFRQRSPVETIFGKT